MPNPARNSEPAVPITDMIRTIRDQKVILDSDLAQLYAVPTYRFNEAVKRNLSRFPEDFRFQLTEAEFDSLRSQIAILKTGRGKHRKYLPYAFTEHGAIMAANILNSQRAVGMSVSIVRAFVQMRSALLTNQQFAQRLSEIEKSLADHDQALRELFRQLRPILLPKEEAKRREIGFHVKSQSKPKPQAQKNLQR